MAGHSHWANISRSKGVADKKRGALFGKLSRAIIVAARVGGGDPTMNLRLRYAIDKAKAASMPKDTIERAVKKGTGDLEGETYDSCAYEGYGPGGAAILCDILTDNRNRTAGEIRRIFDLHGGNLGSTNCVAWMFERKGVFAVLAGVTEDRLLEIALEAGADDVKAESQGFTVTCPTESFQVVADALRAAGVEPESAEVALVPQSTVDVGVEDARTLIELLEALEEQDDVQGVTSNFNIPDELLAELAGG